MQSIFFSSCLVVIFISQSSADTERWSWGKIEGASSEEDNKAGIGFLVESSIPQAIQTRQGKKIDVGDVKEKGKSEGRFFGLKDKMCKHGIGFNCGEGYEIFEVGSSYGTPIASYPAHGYGGGHHSGSGISAHHVKYVQPVALQPVGIPIQAVPLEHAGSLGNPAIPHVGGGYGPPSVPPSIEYGPPSISYGQPSGSYGPPSIPVAPGPTYHEPSPSFHDIPIANDYSEPQAQIVNHYHTHIHKGDSDNAYDSGYSGSSSSINTFSSNSHESLPVVQPSPSAFGSFYREDCECVANYLCPVSDIVGRKNGLPLIDARNKKSNVLSIASGEADKRGFSEVKVGVALDFSDGILKTDRVKRDILDSRENSFAGSQGRLPSARIRNLPGRNGCASGLVCCRSRAFAAREIRQATCGRSSAKGLLGRVTGANFKSRGGTEFGEYPWQAAILKREPKELLYVCGATLIDERYVATAAHCVNGMGPSDLKVRLGEWDMNSKSEFYSHVETEVEEIIVHPSFYSGTLKNDLALLRLRSNMDLNSNPHITPACLPTDFDSFSGQNCYVSGWGKDDFGNSGEFQEVLKEVQVKIWEHGSCEDVLKRTRLGRGYILDKGMICAGGEENKDACKGDGGGPLVCRNKEGSMALAGIVSWGLGCGERGLPGVYVNIPHYIDWIRRNVR